MTGVRVQRAAHHSAPVHIITALAPVHIITALAPVHIITALAPVHIITALAPVHIITALAPVHIITALALRTCIHPPRRAVCHCRVCIEYSRAAGDQAAEGRACVAAASCQQRLGHSSDAASALEAYLSLPRSQVWRCQAHATIDILVVLSTVA
jgi:hypothetical protein